MVDAIAVILAVLSLLGKAAFYTVILLAAIKILSSEGGKK